MTYKVLWIDDLYKTQSDLIGYAEQEDIDLVPKESHEEGMMELEQNLKNYHAVILDAKVKYKPGDQTASLKGLKASRDRLLQLNENTYIPYFIFTGQPDYMASELFKDSYGDYYVKGLDNERLFQDIKNAIEKKEEYQIQRKYKKVFDATQHFGSEVSQLLLSALLNLENPKKHENTEDLFTPLRKIIEKIFKKFNELQILPDEVYKGKGWINSSSKFLSGNHEDYEINQQIFHPTVASIVWNALNICQDASHGEGTLKLKVDDHIRNNGSAYLYCSVVFQLLEVILWCKHYASMNSDPVANKDNWKSKKDIWIKGTITEISHKGWGRFEPHDGSDYIGVPPEMVNDYSLTLHQVIRLATKPSPKGDKLFVKSIKVAH